MRLGTKTLIAIITIVMCGYIWDGVKGADQDSKTTSGVGAQPTPPSGQDRPCTAMREIYPGKISNGTWRPESCKLKQFTHTEVLACMKTQRFYAITDSLGRDIMNRQIKAYTSAKKSEGTPETLPVSSVIEYTWAASSASSFGYLTRDAPKRDTGSFFRNNATFVLFSNGLWDIGAHSCGLIHFFDYLTMKIKRYREEMAPGARMVLYAIPYIHYKPNSYKNWSIICNPSHRVALYREVLDQVASCLGVGILDTYTMKKVHADLSPDGVHFNSEGNDAISNLIHNMMCLPQSIRLEPHHPNLPCTDEAIRAAKDRWAAAPVVNGPPVGCPLGDFVCYKSPEDYLSRKRLKL